MLKQINIILGFDYGTKRIGMAVGQTITKTATPLSIIPVKDQVPHWQEIDAAILEWEPDMLLVGIPYRLDGTEQAVTIHAREFASQLKARYQRSVIGIDERLSTKEAKAQVFASGGYQALKKSAIDAIVAKLLIEQWFTEPQHAYEL